MNKRTTLPLVVLVAVIGLVLGTFGTATAAGITAKQVKKIATKAANKAIKKQASSLSVASAATATNAGNATNLAGQPASRYDNPSYSYLLDSDGGTTAWSFPGLPAGNYNVSWSVLFSDGVTGDFCALFPSGDSEIYHGFTYYASEGSYSTNAASTPLAVAAGQAPSLQCSGGSLYVDPQYPSYVTFTKVGSLTSTTVASVAPRGHGRPHSGPAGR